MKTSFPIHLIRVFLVATLFMTLSGAPSTHLPVQSGAVLFQGVPYPIYPGVEEVYVTNAGIGYQWSVNTRKEGDAIGEKIAGFYEGKRFGTNEIKSAITKRVFLDRTTFANNVSETTNRGASVKITTTSSKVSVELRHSNPPPALAYPQGPFKADWNSLSQYRCPPWFQDAKFGIWAHWGPQSEPEAGDWYARNMYIQGHEQYKYHLEHYGHPSEFGFKDVIRQWKAENFDPEKLLTLYKKIGARYFVALAVHHDNFDLWNSTWQPWNSVNMGPKKDIVGGWAAAARKLGLPFGVSFHARSTWTWYEVTQVSDAVGPKAGIPYDGRLTKADGKGTWWEGYDPNDLYGQYGHTPSPYATNRKLQHQNPGEQPCEEFRTKLYNRAQDLITKYNLDLLYFDDYKLPLYGADQTYGLSIAAGLYNHSLAVNGGSNMAIFNAKALSDFESTALVKDLEVGVERDIRDFPWQVDACIGSWHYKKGVKYRSSGAVIRGLIDVVSKNGNLLLSVPIRRDGTIDEEEQKVVEGIGEWFAVNGEAIHGTRPWTVFGEGPSIVEKRPDREKGGIEFYRKEAYTENDFRFTAKGETLYAFSMAWPKNGSLTIESLKIGAAHLSGEITGVSLLGSKETLTYHRTKEGLQVSMPPSKPCDHAFTLKITGLKWPILKHRGPGLDSGDQGE